MATEFKMPSETEMFSKLMLPLVEKIGFARASAAFEQSKLKQMFESVTQTGNAQLAMDVLYVTEHFCKTLREMTAEKDAKSEVLQ